MWGGDWSAGLGGHSEGVEAPGTKRPPAATVARDYTAWCARPGSESRGRGGPGLRDGASAAMVEGAG